MSLIGASGSTTLSSHRSIAQVIPALPAKGLRLRVAGGENPTVLLRLPLYVLHCPSIRMWPYAPEVGVQHMPVVLLAYRTFSYKKCKKQNDIQSFGEPMLLLYRWLLHPSAIAVGLHTPLSSPFLFNQLVLSSLRSRHSEHHAGLNIRSQRLHTETPQT